jgi:hypothetical protein
LRSPSVNTGQSSRVARKIDGNNMAMQVPLVVSAFALLPIVDRTCWELSLIIHRGEAVTR